MLTEYQIANAHAFHFGECKRIVGPRGGVTITREVWRRNGSTKRWKRQPNRFSIPVKYGFRGPYTYVTDDNAHMFHAEAACDILR